MLHAVARTGNFQELGVYRERFLAATAPGTAAMPEGRDNHRARLKNVPRRMNRDEIF
jgi:hypothetical protein